jgi:hypothetical protein
MINVHEQALTRSISSILVKKSICVIDVEEVIEPYEQVLTKERAEELLKQVAEKIEPYDWIVYFRGGASEEYYNLLELACYIAFKHFISFGHKHLGEIDLFSTAIYLLS